jgi:hypothetical protein
LSEIITIRFRHWHQLEAIYTLIVYVLIFMAIAIRNFYTQIDTAHAGKLCTLRETA